MRPGEGCLSCRERHIKCTKVEGSTSCLKCQEARRECQRDSSIRFKAITSVNEKPPHAKKRKRYRFNYETGQSWMKIPRPIQFVNSHDEPDEATRAEETTTSDLQINNIDRSSAAHSELDTFSHVSEPILDDARSTHHGYSGSYDQVLDSLPSILTPSPTDHLRTHSESLSLLSAHSKQSPSVVSSSCALLSPGISPLNQPFSLWPLKSTEEASLLRHFVHHLSSWFDVNDWACHFATEVPQRAVHYPVLLYAIFAFASLHRNTTTGKENTTPEEYYSQCLQILIPVLNDPQAVFDENFLAAIVILRSYEEMSQMDEKTHLLGTARLLNSITDFASSGGLGEAASWTCLRQDIYVSLTSCRPLNIHLDNYSASRSFYGTDDGTWANRIVHIFARTLNAAFGNPSDLTIADWDQLERDVNEWNSTKPWTFTPLLDASAADQRDVVFPMIWMLRPAHVVGNQHYCMAKIMLATCNPRNPKSGFGAFKAWRAEEEIILQNIRMILGLTINNDYGVASFHASHLLTACGSLLRDPREQEAAVEFLVNMEKKMGWRTQHVVQSLRSQWR